MRELFDRLAGGLRTTVLGGISLFWLAPLIPLIAIVPEFAQHIAEIQLGMFDSKAAFAAGADDPQRWFFAYFKIAGLLVAVLAAARFLGGAGKRWWDLRTIAWKPFLIALGLNIAASLIGMLAMEILDDDVPTGLELGYQIATLPLLIMFVGPLFGDRDMTLSRAYTSGWLAVVMISALFLLAWAPAQWLHQQNHIWAMGQSDPVVWALMVWDSLLVGLMACWMGAALAAGYWLGRAPLPRGEASVTDSARDPA